MPSKTFKNLSEFILNHMRMSQIYQPVMLKALLKGSGKSKVREYGSLMESATNRKGN